MDRCARCGEIRNVDRYKICKNCANDMADDIRPTSSSSSRKQNGGEQ